MFFTYFLEKGRRCDAKCYRFSVDDGNHNGKDGNEDKDDNNDMIRENYDEVTMVLIMTIITIITLTILDSSFSSSSSSPSPFKNYHSNIQKRNILYQINSVSGVCSTIPRDQHDRLVRGV